MAYAGAALPHWRGSVSVSPFLRLPFLRLPFPRLAFPSLPSRLSLPLSPFHVSPPPLHASPGPLLRQPGLYRVCGVDRSVKELREKFLHTRAVPALSKVEDVHVICSLLKDFLRNLKEPLLTFRLNQTFMQTAGEPRRWLCSLRAQKRCENAPEGPLLMLNFHRGKILQV